MHLRGSHITWLTNSMDQVQGFPSNATVSIVVYYFIQIIRYMFWSYDHLQVGIYTSEINMNKIVNNY
jgi:hypothetical protein